MLAYQAVVHGAVDHHHASLSDFVEENRALPRKEFAAKLMSSFDKWITGAAFTMLDGDDGRAVLLDKLRRASQSDSRVDAMRDLFGFEWSMNGLLLLEGGKLQFALGSAKAAVGWENSCAAPSDRAPGALCEHKKSFLEMRGLGHHY